MIFSVPKHKLFSHSFQNPNWMEKCGIFLSRASRTIYLLLFYYIEFTKIFSFPRKKTAQTNKNIRNRLFLLIKIFLEKWKSLHVSRRILFFFCFVNVSGWKNSIVDFLDIHSKPKMPISVVSPACMYNIPYHYNPTYVHSSLYSIFVKEDWGLEITWTICVRNFL